MKRERKRESELDSTRAQLILLGMCLWVWAYDLIGVHLYWG